MGWNRNCWGLSVDDAKVRAAVDQFISTGLINHGWTYVNIDDGWEAPERAANGKIVTNDKFPDMKGLTGYVHSKGMKMGIYSSPGPLTCGGYLGSYSHEFQDAQSWADWGIDYIKYDWCSYGEKAKDNSLAELQKPYILMKQCLGKQDRDIVFSLCQYGMGDVSKWGGQVGGNLWRTTGDITDTWESMSGIGFGQADLAPYAKPGEWNDPDMLVVGWVGWGPSLHPSRLSASEQYTHISLWALLSAPLLIGCDLTKLDDFTLNLLTNDEVIAINQDPLGKQAVLVKSEKSIQLWVKELEDGSKAVGLFNLSDKDQETGLSFADLKIAGKAKLRDAWRQKDLGEFEGQYPCKIPAHGVVLLRILQ
ncbi:MAG: glycoside hydrolase family 27 protein [Bacteroidales bacterium]